MSTTKSLEVALEYSGVQKGNGTVLAMEMSEVDQGAILQEFSQYPGEEETLWNACSYMEALKGKEEWRLTKWGLVKLVYIKMNASGRALTVEELEYQRKGTVVNMLETMRGDISRYMATAPKNTILSRRPHKSFAQRTSMLLSRKRTKVAWKWWTGIASRSRLGSMPTKSLPKLSRLQPHCQSWHAAGSSATSRMKTGSSLTLRHGTS